MLGRDQTNLTKSPGRVLIEEERRNSSKGEWWDDNLHGALLSIVPRRGPCDDTLSLELERGFKGLRNEIDYMYLMFSKPLDFIELGIAWFETVMSA